MNNLLLYINWNINPEIFNLFGISIRYYGLLFAAGLFLCGAIIQWVFKREKLGLENFDKLRVQGWAIACFTNPVIIFNIH
jgi:phosphatidylglycerol---prolipoprotein diacylglyceryl transferase